MEIDKLPLLVGSVVGGELVLPYHRVYRPCRKAPNSGYNSWIYLTDHEYAKLPINYTHPFLSLQKDIVNLFEYVAPADKNLKTYSYRIQQLLIRVCVEIEANFKAIFKENHYTRKDESQWNINDYRVINQSHHLSSYKIRFPDWEGNSSVFVPFLPWAEGKALYWYKAYNDTKHNRIEKREKANLFNLLSAFAALAIVESAQFSDESYTPGPTLFSTGGGDSYYGDVSYAIGDYLIVEYPDDWKDEELYNFEWNEVKNMPNRFRKFDYDALCNKL